MLGNKISTAFLTNCLTLQTAFITVLKELLNALNGMAKILTPFLTLPLQLHVDLSVLFRNGQYRWISWKAQFIPLGIHFRDQRKCVQ